MQSLGTKRALLRKRSQKGFTLMEMLIVVAIIAVLVAIAIPVFTSQLNTSKDSADEANARSLYAVLSADYLDDGKTSFMIDKTDISSGSKDTITLTDGENKQTFTFSDRHKGVKIYGITTSSSKGSSYSGTPGVEITIGEKTGSMIFGNKSSSAAQPSASQPDDGE